MNPKLPSLMEMLAQLIATPSMSSVSPEFDISNRPVIDLLAQWLSAMGFKVEILPIPAQPHKANLLATLGEIRPGSQGLMLAGHTDTVPYDAHRWRYDPFVLTEREGRLYGLGTCDMKSFFALAIEALKDFQAKDLKHPVVILATADEESSMDGAKLMVDLGCPYVKHAVIGEPTGLKPVNAHKGIMMEAIRLKGKSGHSSNPALGINAIEVMRDVITELLKWRDELQIQYRDPRFNVPYPTLNLGHIFGGDNPNRICGECELHFDLRALPGMGLDELRALLKKRVERAVMGSGVELEIFSLIDGTAPMLTPEDSPIVHACEHYSGTCAHAVAFCTEAPYLAAIGIQPVVMGPGEIAQAHQPDEFIAVSQLQPSVALIKNLVRHFCC